MLLDPHQFPFVAVLEEHWRTVRGELQGLGAGDFMPWYDVEAYNEGWNVYGLLATVHEARDLIDPQVRQRCPATMALLDGIPGVTLAAFSTLLPGAVVYPHTDLDTGTVRCHLPLQVPTGARFRLEAEDVEWTEGRCTVFDNRRQHAAANESTRPRFLLLLDVLRATYGVPD